MIQLPKRTFLGSLNRSVDMDALEKALNTPMACYGYIDGATPSGKAAADYFEREVTVHPHFEPDRAEWKPSNWGFRWLDLEMWPYIPGKNHTASTTTLGAAVGDMVEVLG